LVFRQALDPTKAVLEPLLISPFTTDPDNRALAGPTQD